jgi:hypothetical protein
VRRIGELEIFQCFHLRKVGLFNPPRNRVAIALFDLSSEQRFQIAEMTLLSFVAISAEHPRPQQVFLLSSFWWLRSCLPSRCFGCAFWFDRGIAGRLRSGSSMSTRASYIFVLLNSNSVRSSLIGL